MCTDVFSCSLREVYVCVLLSSHFSQRSIQSQLIGRKWVTSPPKVGLISRGSDREWPTEEEEWLIWECVHAYMILSHHDLFLSVMWYCVHLNVNNEAFMRPTHFRSKVSPKRFCSFPASVSFQASIHRRHISLQRLYLWMRVVHRKLWFGSPNGPRWMNL